MEWPYIEKVGTFDEVSDLFKLLYKSLKEESALRAGELDVPFTDGYNVILGHEAGESMAISIDDTEGLYNVFIGHQAGYSNTTAVQNIGLGYQALYSNVDSDQNVEIGNQALYSTAGVGSISGNSNVAIGYLAARLNTLGSQNIAIGAAALEDNTKAGANIAIGGGALGVFNVATKTDTENIAIGVASLTRLTTGEENVSIGAQAGIWNLTGSGNVFLGYQAGYNETGSNTLYIANDNTTTPLIGGVFPNTSLTFTSAASTFSGTLGCGAITSTGTIQGTTAKLTGLTDGYVPYHVADATGLADSVVFTDGTNVGIGTATPGSYKLYIDGGLGLQVYRNGAIAQVMIHEDAGTHDAKLRLRRGSVDWYTGMIDSSNYTIMWESTSYVTIDTSGNVGIGKTPSNKLDIDLATEDLEVVDAGSAGATEQDWIQVEVGGNIGYIRVFSTG